MKIYMQFDPDYDKKSIVPKLSFHNDQGNMDYSHLMFKSLNFEWMGTMTRLILAHRDGYYEFIRFCSILNVPNRKPRKSGIIRKT